MLDSDLVRPVGQKPEVFDEKSCSLAHDVSDSEQTPWASGSPSVAVRDTEEECEPEECEPEILSATTQLSKTRQRILMVTMASSGLLNVRAHPSTGRQAGQSHPAPFHRSCSRVLAARIGWTLSIDKNLHVLMHRSSLYNQQSSCSPRLGQLCPYPQAGSR